MKSWTWSDNAFVPCDAAPLSDRGFRYGMSVFESLPVRNGGPVFLRDHLDRLRKACRQTGFTVENEALHNCGDVLRRSVDGFARIYVTAGDGAVTAAFENCRVFIFVEPREPVAGRVYHRGYDLGISPEPHQPIFGGLKTANYWANLGAFRRGVARQKNEILLFNPRGELISACMANVFLVSDGRKIQTPSLESGARNGVVREWILQCREVEQRTLTREDVEKADEIFLTSSWLGVMPGASLETKPLATQSTARELLREYRATVSRGE